MRGQNSSFTQLRATKTSMPASLRSPRSRSEIVSPGCRARTASRLRFGRSHACGMRTSAPPRGSSGTEQLYPWWSMASLGPITLSGKHVRLEPMRPAHAAALLEAGRSSEIWEWMPARPLTPDTMKSWLETAIQAESHGCEYPFVVVRTDDERVIGSTRYLDVQEDDRTVEIGWTWYAPDAWGGVVNPEAKYRLIRHAFADLAAVRGGLETDVNNLRSQAAIKKLRARYEGTPRHQRNPPDW